jgi:hypothetical protein
MEGGRPTGSGSARPVRHHRHGRRSNNGARESPRGRRLPWQRAGVPAQRPYQYDGLWYCEYPG